MYSHNRTIVSAQVIDQLLPNLNADERKLAKEPGMGGRIWFGQGLVFDEAYGILMTLGILTDPKQAGKDTAHTSGQNTNQGWYNRFVQTGKSESETKTNGSFGGLEVGPVGSSWTGNLHPTPTIELVKGIRGDAGCMAKARACLQSLSSSSHEGLCTWFCHIASTFD